jgi:hypothetical protein
MELFCRPFLLVFLLVLLSIEGCFSSNDTELLYFDEKISELLNGKNSVRVIASELTNFSWKSLCFERNSKLKLNFILTDSKVVFNLSYDKYFIDEAYVAGSLDGKCIASNDEIIIRLKYPGYTQIIEFFDANYKDIDNVSTD